MTQNLIERPQYDFREGLGRRRGLQRAGKDPDLIIRKAAEDINLQAERDDTVEQEAVT